MLKVKVRSLHSTMIHKKEFSSNERANTVSQVTSNRTPTQSRRQIPEFGKPGDHRQESKSIINKSKKLMIVGGQLREEHAEPLIPFSVDIEEGRGEYTEQKDMSGFTDNKE